MFAGISKGRKCTEEARVQLSVIVRFAIFSSLVLKTFLKIKFDGKAFDFDKLG